MTDKIEYYCYTCRETRNTYCETNIEIGQEPDQTWPNDQTPCILQSDQDRKNGCILITRAGVLN